MQGQPLFRTFETDLTERIGSAFEIAMHVSAHEAEKETYAFQDR
jgi:hypothetical protein